MNDDETNDPCVETYRHAVGAAAGHGGGAKHGGRDDSRAHVSGTRLAGGGSGGTEAHGGDGGHGGHG